MSYDTLPFALSSLDANKFQRDTITGNLSLYGFPGYMNQIEEVRQDQLLRITNPGLWAEKQLEKERKQRKSLEQRVDELERSRDDFRNLYRQEKKEKEELIIKNDPKLRRLSIQDYQHPFEDIGKAWVD